MHAHQTIEELVAEEAAFPGIEEKAYELYDEAFLHAIQNGTPKRPADERAFDPTAKENHGQISVRYDVL